MSFAIYIEKFTGNLVVGLSIFLGFFSPSVHGAPQLEIHTYSNTAYSPLFTLWIDTVNNQDLYAGSQYGMIKYDGANRGTADSQIAGIPSFTGNNINEGDRATSAKLGGDHRGVTGEKIHFSFSSKKS